MSSCSSRICRMPFDSALYAALYAATLNRSSSDIVSVSLAATARPREWAGMEFGKAGDKVADGPVEFGTVLDVTRVRRIFEHRPAGRVTKIRQGLSQSHLSLWDTSWPSISKLRVHPSSGMKVTVDLARCTERGAADSAAKQNHGWSAAYSSGASSGRLRRIPGPTYARSPEFEPINFRAQAAASVEDFEFVVGQTGSSRQGRRRGPPSPPRFVATDRFRSP